MFADELNTSFPAFAESIVDAVCANTFPIRSSLDKYFKSYNCSFVRLGIEFYWIFNSSKHLNILHTVADYLIAVSRSVYIR